MPYIKEQDKSVVRDFGHRNPGDLNFLFTEALHDYFMENGARYQQIHEIGCVIVAALCQVESIKKCLMEELTNQEMKLFKKLGDLGRFSPLRVIDTIATLEEAHAEFRRRVVGPYEDLCILKNGDVMRADLKAKLSGE